MNGHSRLIRMKIVNLGCIGPNGLEVELDNILCLVGPNNTGKSTVLRAYEAAVGNQTLEEEEICDRASDQPTTVEIWVHIPEGTQNIDEKWKEAEGDLLLVRSKWEWQGAAKPIRSTWDPEISDYAEHGKAAGLDEVFSSRLPQPFRIHALQNPDEEHKALLNLVLDPIVQELKTLMEQEDSDLRNALRAFNNAAEAPVVKFSETLKTVRERVNKSYRRVFSGSEIDLQVGMAEVNIDPRKYLADGSNFTVRERGSETRWQQQGTGSQRTLFWSMLEVRSELKKAQNAAKQVDKLKQDIDKRIAKAEKAREDAKKAETKQKWQDEIDTLKKQRAALAEGGADKATDNGVILPGYMLLIDEPEVALHPNAVRAAQAHLYDLAQDPGWQVMLSTHCPAFINPLADHTTIVRLVRDTTDPSPKTFRSDSIALSTEEKENLKMLLLFDVSLTEMFFGAYPLIVEGDTEFAAFHKVMSAFEDKYPLERRPLVVRARGKEIIPGIIKILRQFRVKFSVLHDADSPRTTNGKRANPAWSANTRIHDEVKLARDDGLTVIHRVSVPEFERHHNLQLGSKDKPYKTWQAANNDAVLTEIQRTFDQLVGGSDEEPFGGGQDFEEGLRQAVQTWAVANAPQNPAFDFTNA